MQNFKSHFTFSKEQRNGIFFLVLIIIGLQCVYFFVDISPNEIQVNQHEMSKFNKEIDSLKLIQIEARKPIIYPFNPNYITDYKGASLGLSNEEIDRLLNYRKHNQWINSTQQFQDVTKISDSLLSVISPYFKFPEWVTNSKPSNNNSNTTYNNNPKLFSQKQDLNVVSAIQLQRINGIGVVLSERIIKFRNKFKGGFIADVQLEDVYGLTSEVIEKIKNEFTVKTPRQIIKINLNEASIDELVTIQHIDYDIAYSIIEQRQLREGYKSISELKKVKDFPVNKIKIIELYLQLD